MWLPIDCVPEDLYLCVHDQWSRTVINIKTKLHLMLRPCYILLYLTPLILISHILSSVHHSRSFTMLTYYRPVRYACSPSGCVTAWVVYTADSIRDSIRTRKKTIRRSLPHKVCSFSKFTYRSRFLATHFCVYGRGWTELFNGVCLHFNCNCETSGNCINSVDGSILKLFSVQHLRV